ncbi:MAG: GTP 3',8-cyclase MoaA [Lawsonibacter sp.]
MNDYFGREITYLRISVTDRCNLRCQYCMPEEGIVKQPHCDILSLEEIAEIAREAVGLGIRKIRITGGEPLVRRGILSLCRELAQLPGLEDLALTTNGTLLAPIAKELKAAGVGRVNISLDTLDPDKYHTITRLGQLEDALSGIRAAMEAGLTPLKINTVLIGGFNDDEIPDLVALTQQSPIELRFIELMPIGHASPFGKEAYLPCGTVLERVPNLQPMEKNGVAELYRLPGAAGSVGLIRPISHLFCGECNRIRLTADGYLKPCLFSTEEIPLHGLHGEMLRKRLETAIAHKPAKHGVLTSAEHAGSARDMNQIGG